VHFDGYTNLPLIHAREGKIIIVVDGRTYCLGKIGAAFEYGSRSWRLGKEQPSNRAQEVDDGKSGLRRGLKKLTMERAAFEEGSCS
jgi:hypothetical protein